MKTLSFSVKAMGISVNDQGQEIGKIEAYGAMYGNIDEGNDRIVAGACKRTIQNSKSRAKSRNKDYLLPMIWNHNTDNFLPIGGWYHVDPDDPQGLLGKADVLLTTQVGREYYELAKAGMTDSFSIVYDIPQGGARYDKSGVRELTEIRLFSIDPVIFPMNDETYLVGVKSMENKAACGDTSLPIGERNASWSGSTAHSQIVSWAKKEDGSVDASKMRKVFLKRDGEADKVTSYGYPFCNIVNGSPIVNVGGVKACAGAISGARGADAGGDTKAMQGKVNTLYGRINAKYPDATPLVPPWKGKSMNEEPRAQKSLMDHYNDSMCKDLLEDWQEVYIAALTGAVFDAFSIGDEPSTDINQALIDFKKIVLEKFLPQAIEHNLSQYITDASYNPMSRTMQDGSTGYYGFMSRQKELQQKRVSSSNQSIVDGHIAKIKSMAAKHSTEICTAADDFATTIQGSEPVYAGDDPGKPEDGQQEGKNIADALAELQLLRK